MRTACADRRRPFSGPTGRACRWTALRRCTRPSPPAVAPQLCPGAEPGAEENGLPFAAGRSGPPGPAGPAPAAGAGETVFRPEKPSAFPSGSCPGSSGPIPEAGLRARRERAGNNGEINGLFKTYLFKYEKICGKITCTGRRPGIGPHPAGRGCGKSLKALFLEAGMTQPERDRTLVLRDEAGILAVLGFGLDERARPRGRGDRVLRELENIESTNK